MPERDKVPEKYEHLLEDGSYQFVLEEGLSKQKCRGFESSREFVMSKAWDLLKNKGYDTFEKAMEKAWDDLDKKCKKLGVPEDEIAGEFPKQKSKKEFEIQVSSSEKSKSSSNGDKDATRLWKSVSPEGWRRDEKKTDPSLDVYFWLKEAPADYAGATYTRLMVSAMRKEGRWLLARKEYDENDKEIHQYNIVKINNSPAKAGRSNVEEVFHRAEQYMKENKPREGQELPKPKQTKWGALRAEKVEKPKSEQKTLTGKRAEEKPKPKKVEEKEEEGTVFKGQQKVGKYGKKQKKFEEYSEETVEKLEEMIEDLED